MIGDEIEVAVLAIPGARAIPKRAASAAVHDLGVDDDGRIAAGSEIVRIGRRV